ncbi:caspase family protein [Streptomyces phaeochromogenes]|uniref:Caspase family protein n=1 Tax=Streptomyces phaeochromogenes TaxID=1923 RepID=A0ABZ1HRK5_STRPH|nr:hypothetical protein [Streptomyces phaeochromogenes]WSD21238.1 caspase family protein [Streptomyces phaeochromogenes]
MTAPIDPAKTQALVVAVERYEDPAWNVNGPYVDACAFITWLVDACGVPAENVSFYASALAASLRQAEVGRLLPAGVKTKDADSALVARHIQEGMVGLDADLLWVFWSGHGVVDSNGSHVLLLADSSVATKRAIAVDALQLALQSRRVGSNGGLGVPKIAVAVNACQNQPAGVEVALTDVTTTSTRVTDRGLFVMHACSTGQKARNIRAGAMRGKAAATGLFPRTLLTSLHDGSGRVLPDLHRVSDDIDRAFATLRSDSQTLQKPSLLRRNWDGRTLRTGDFALAPTERERALAALLEAALPDGADRNACAERLAARMPVVVPVSDCADDCSVEQLVTAASRVVHGIPTLVDVLVGTGPSGDGPLADASKERPPLDAPQTAALYQAARRVRPDEFLTHEEYTALVEALDPVGVPDASATARLDRTLRHHLPDRPTDLGTLVKALEAAGAHSEAGAVPALLRFVCLAAAEADACGGDGRALRAWVRQVADRIGSTADALAALMQAAVEGCIRRRAEKTWLMVRIDASHPETGACRYAFSAWIHDSVSGVANLDSTRDFLSWREVQYRLSTVVEPYVADDRLSLAVEFFLPVGHMELQVERIPMSYREVDSVPLGTVAPVVVRYAQRRTAWSARWDACGADTAAGDHHWLRHDALDLPRLHTALQARPLAGCIELTGPHAEFTPALAYCAQAGVPVMAWHRQLGERRAVRDLAPLRQVVHPRDLPEELRQLRAGAREPSDGGGSGLVLLWDDPHRLLPRMRPRSPGRTPRP